MTHEQMQGGKYTCKVMVLVHDMSSESGYHNSASDIFGEISL